MNEKLEKSCKPYTSGGGSEHDSERKWPIANGKFGDSEWQISDSEREIDDSEREIGDSELLQAIANYSEYQFVFVYNEIWSCTYLVKYPKLQSPQYWGLTKQISVSDKIPTVHGSSVATLQNWAPQLDQYNILCLHTVCYSVGDNTEAVNYNDGLLVHPEW